MPPAQIMRETGEKAEKYPLHIMMNEVMLQLSQEMFPDQFPASAKWKNVSDETKEEQQATKSTADYKMWKDPDSSTSSHVELLMGLETKSTKTGRNRPASASDFERGIFKGWHSKSVDVSMAQAQRRDANRAQTKKQLQHLLEAQVPGFVGYVVDEAQEDVAYGMQITTARAAARSSRLTKRGATAFKLAQDISMSAALDVMRYLQPETKKKRTGANAYILDNTTGVFKTEEKGLPAVSKKAAPRYYLSLSDVARKKGLYSVAYLGVPFLVGGKTGTDPSGLASAKRQLLQSRLFRDTHRKGLLAEMHRNRKEITMQGVNIRERSGSPLHTGTVFQSERAGASPAEQEKAITVNVLVNPNSVSGLIHGLQIVAPSAAGRVAAKVSIEGKQRASHLEAKVTKEVKVKASKGKKAYTRSKPKKK